MRAEVLIVRRPLTDADRTSAARLLTAIQAADAVACAIPLGIIRRDLDRLGCSETLQRAIPIVKGASVVGLAAGAVRPELGRVTTAALLAYFGCAIGAHARVGDPAWRYAGAIGMTGLTLAARRAYR